MREETAIDKAGRFAETAAMLAMVQSMVEIEEQAKELVPEEERDLGWKLLFSMPVCGEA